MQLFSVALGAVELGIIYSIMSLGVFISYRTLNTADLTVDSSFTTGAAVSAVLCLSGHPIAAVAAAFGAGCIAGLITAVLHTKLGIAALLSGILMMLGLYSVNLRIMAGKPNVSLARVDSIFTLFGSGKFGKLFISLGILIFAITILYFFLKTKLGFVLRATGDNESMVRACGVDTDSMKHLGMSLANGLVALSGALISQYQKFCDIQMGVGMVVIGLASVIIGEVAFGTNPLLRRIIAVAFGSVLYRIVIAAALQAGMPPTDLKLVSEVIVAAALVAPTLTRRIRSGETRDA